MTRHRSWPRGRGSSWVSNYSSKIMNRWKFPNWAISGDRVLWGMLQVLGQFGAVPRRWYGTRRGVSGGGGEAVRCLPPSSRRSGACWEGERCCAARPTPSSRGRWNRVTDIWETSFLPGRRFEDVADFNRQLLGWLKRANQPIHGTTRTRPAEAIYEDRGR